MGRWEGLDPIILDGAVGAAYGTAGRLEDWQASVGALTTNQPIPILAISAALAGPLLQLANVGGGGITLTGQSSKGKTTVLQAAASVWGKGSESGGFVRSWRATANGLEGAAAGSSDTALVLDEIGTIRSDEMAAALYALGNGAGKARATRDGGLREPKSWRVMMISSGELGIVSQPVV